MRSFHLQSLLSSIFLLSHTLGYAQHFNGHEKPGVRSRHANNFRKRDTFTYFQDGLGACGVVNNSTDFIVALNSADYAGGTHCFEMITITIGGKTSQAQITDECVSCSPGGLDFSQSLFEYFAPLSEGEIYGSWSYNSDISTSSSTSPATISSGTPTSVPTSTMAATTSSPTTLQTSSATATVPSSTSISSTVPSSIPQDPQVIAQIDLALLELGALLQVSLALQA